MQRPRFSTLGDLWAAGRQGIPLTDLAGVTKLGLTPTPGAVTLDVFPDGHAGNSAIQDGQALYEPGMLLTPGGELCFAKPLQNHAVIRLHLFGSTAFSPQGTAPKIASAGLGSNPPPTDGPLMDARAPVFLHDGCEHHAALQYPRSITVPAIAMADGTVAPQTFSSTATLNIALRFPWETIPLEIARRYRRLLFVHGTDGVPAVGAASGVSYALVPVRPSAWVASDVYLQTIAKVEASARPANNVVQLFGGAVRLNCGAPADWATPFAPNNLPTSKAMRAEQAVNVQGYWVLDDGDAQPGRFVSSFLQAVMSLQTAEVASILAINAGGQTLHVSLVSMASGGVQLDVYSIDNQGAYGLISGAAPTTNPFTSVTMAAPGQYYINLPQGAFYARYTSLDTNAGVRTTLVG